MAAKRPTKTVMFLMAALLMTLLVPGAMSLYIDSLWFADLGYSTVFQRELTTKLLLMLGVGALSFVVIYLNLRFAQRNPSAHPVRLRTAPSQDLVDIAGTVSKLTLVFALVFAATTGLAAMGNWLTLLQFLNAQTFGIADPVLGRDVGFYMFKLPMYEWGLALLSSLTVITTLSLLAVFWVRGDLAVLPRRIVLDPSAGIQVGALVAVFFILVALRINFVTIPSLLFSATDQLQGASYTDIHARLPALRVAAVTAILGAIFVAFGAVRRRTVFHTALAGAAYAIVTVVGVNAFPAALQRFKVAPTEFTHEQPQIVNHIAATRHAWGIDSVVMRDLEGDAGLTANDLRNNASTVENVRVWDRDPLLQTFGQLQEIRTYYDFVNVDDDRYWIDGRYRQVLLTARELNSTSLPVRNFINTHLTFTHGMGLTLGPVNQVTSEGLPVLFIKDLPPVSSISVKVTRPQIYFGEITNDFVIVGTKQKEFDYPAGDSAATTSYTGTGGVQLKSEFRRALLAVHFQSMNVLLSRDAGNDSRVLFRREIRDRASRVFPFLILDSDPYLVVDQDGTFKWIIDAYTSSSRYPYSKRIGDNTNYLRNSVKIVIDAYDGNVKGYISDKNDPLIRSFAGAFPGILLPLDSMAATLRAHVRYPEDLFRAQNLLFSVYHMTDAGTYYNREDEWTVPTLDQGQGPVRSPFLRHMVMRLPGEDTAEFIFMTPYTPRGKDNLSAWMVARNDGEHYGQLVVYRFPKQSLVFGPRQVVNRINQDTEVSRQISLWDQGGSEVIRGQLLVIPIEKSIIYVQPIYLRAEGGRIPELKRVVVTYQNRVVMEETLERGLAVIFGEGAANVAPVRPEDRTTAAAPTVGAPSLDARTMDLVRQLQQQYDRAMAAQKAGNWAEYGTAIQRVGELLRDLGSRMPPGRE